jgi:hypothetical protein
MIVMKRLALLVLLLVLSPVPSPAGACDCIRLQPLSAAVRKEAPFIFEGKVVEIVERSVHTLRTTSGGGSSEVQPIGREIVFEVTRAWNGVTSKRLTVSADQSDCMFPFAVDHAYVVFAWKDAKGNPATSICTRTIESSKAADVIAALGPPTAPVARPVAATGRAVL